MRDISLRIMFARYPGKCAETGRWINRGERIVFAPLSRRIYSSASKMFQATQKAQCQQRVSA